MATKSELEGKYSHKLSSGQASYARIELPSCSLRDLKAGQTLIAEGYSRFATLEECRKINKLLKPQALQMDNSVLR